MPYNFDEVVDRSQNYAAKFEEAELHYGTNQVIPLWIADMDFRTAPCVVEAIKERADQGIFGYTWRTPRYFESIAAWQQKRNGWLPEINKMAFAPGVVPAMRMVLNMFTQPGDKIIIQQPVYHPFADVVENTGRTLVVSPLKRDEDGYYTMDLEDFEAKARDGAKYFILCNPHNPVGRVWTREELERVGELCLKHQVPIFSDDIHSDIILPGYTYTPLPALSPEIADITVLAMAPSKTFNIAGLKSSLMVVPNPRLRKKINQGLQAFHMGVDLFGLKATEAAYRLGGPWVDQMNQYLLDSAKTVAEFCQNRLPKVKTRIPEGTYLMWLDFSGYGLTQKELMEKLKLEAGVALNDGSQYGPEGQGFVRLNISTARPFLMEGLERIAKCFG